MSIRLRRWFTSSPIQAIWKQPLSLGQTCVDIVFSWFAATAIVVTWGQLERPAAAGDPAPVQRRGSGAGASSPGGTTQGPTKILWLFRGPPWCCFFFFFTECLSEFLRVESDRKFGPNIWAEHLGRKFGPNFGSLNKGMLRCHPKLICIFLLPVMLFSFCKACVFWGSVGSLCHIGLPQAHPYRNGVMTPDLCAIFFITGGIKLLGFMCVVMHVSSGRS